VVSDPDAVAPPEMGFTPTPANLQGPMVCAFAIVRTQPVVWVNSRERGCAYAGGGWRNRLDDLTAA